MLRGELSESGNDVRFDQLGLLVRLRGIVWEDRGAEIGVVDRVVDRFSNLKAGLVGKEGTRNASPHRLRDYMRQRMDELNGWTNGQATERLNGRFGRL